MSTALQLLQEQIALAAQTGADMTEVQKGGSGPRLLPLGVAQARLVEYVEFGQQPQEYKGVAKDPQLEFQLGFALTGFAPNPDPAGQPIPYANEDGSPHIWRPWPMSMSRNEKAGAYLTFKAMNYKGLHKHFAQMLGEAFLLPIVHLQPTKADQKVKSVGDLKNIRPPFYPDPLSGTIVNVPVASARDQDLKFFSWDHPTVEGWNALKVEGEFENKDASGAVTKVSKNRVQEAILGALDFSGSPLELLLKTSGVAFTVPPKKAPPVQAVVPAAVAPAAAPAVVLAVVPTAGIVLPSTAPAVAVPAVVPESTAVATPNVAVVPAAVHSEPVQSSAPVAAVIVAAAPVVVAATPVSLPAVELPVIPGA